VLEAQIASIESEHRTAHSAAQLRAQLAERELTHATRGYSMRSDQLEKDLAEMSAAHAKVRFVFHYHITEYSTIIMLQ